MGVDSHQVTDVALVVTLLATGLLAGLQAHSHPRAWLADRRWLAALLLLNAVAYPIAAALLATVLGLDEAARTGLVVLASCAGGVLGIAVTRVAGADVERAVGAVIVLELLNIVAVPLWTSLLLASGAQVALADVFRTLVLLLLLPTGAGWLIQRRRRAWVPGLVRLLRPTSTVALIVVVGGVLRDNASPFLAALGSSVPLAGVALLLGGMAAGWAMGGPSATGRRTLALVTAGHSTALALAVVRSAFGHQHGVEASIAVLGLIGLILPLLVATAMRVAARDSLPAVSAGG